MERAWLAANSTCRAAGWRWGLWHGLRMGVEVIYGSECWLVQRAQRQRTKHRLIIGPEIVAAMKLRRLISPQLISTLLWWWGRGG